MHNHPNFNDLILILSNELSLSPILIVKDYWIMHCLYGLQNQGMNFQMKGGTSLSKGYNFIQDKETRQKYQNEYELSQSLYHKEKPTFQEILELIEKFADKL